MYNHVFVIDPSKISYPKFNINGNGSSSYRVDIGVSVLSEGTITEKERQGVFANANKRTGLMVLLQMLDLNNIEFKFTQDEMYEMVVGIASRTCDYEHLLEFVKARLVNYNPPGVTQ